MTLKQHETKKLIVIALVSISVLTFFSCENKSENVEKKKVVAPKVTQKWSTFKINVDDKSIMVPLYQDTCYYHEVFRKDTLYFEKHGQLRSESRKFTLSKTERDSLFLYALEAITKPALTYQFVTHYAGKDVGISLSFANTKISCGYSSVDTWTSMSPTLQKISSLTFDKIKKTETK